MQQADLRQIYKKGRQKTVVVLSYIYTSIACVTVGTGGNMLKNIQSVATGNTFTTSPTKGTDTGITALYCRLS